MQIIYAQYALSYVELRAGAAEGKYRRIQGTPAGLIQAHHSAHDGPFHHVRQGADLVERCPPRPLIHHLRIVDGRHGRLAVVMHAVPVGSQFAVSENGLLMSEGGQYQGGVKSKWVSMDSHCQRFLN